MWEVLRYFYRKNLLYKDLKFVGSVQFFYYKNLLYRDLDLKTRVCVKCLALVTVKTYL